LDFVKISANGLRFSGGESTEYADACTEFAARANSPGTDFPADSLKKQSRH
jgi:hypothetical protein